MNFEKMLGDVTALLEERDARLDDTHKGMIQTNTNLAGLGQRMSSLETKLNRRGFGGGDPPELVTFSDLLLTNKSFTDRPSELRRGESLNLTLVTKDISGLGRAMPYTVPGIAGLGTQTPRVRGLIPQVGISTGAVLFTKETTFTNAADVVAEGALKPKSDKVFQTITVPVETIAHFIKCSKQSYQDAAGLAEEIDSNLINGLELKLEQQLLKGSGAPPQLTGMYPLATAATAAPAQSTIIDALFLAVADLAVKGYTANGIVMASADYTAMQLLKDTTGRYLFSAGAVPLPRIVVSPYMAAGEWLVGDFRQTRLFVREEMNVQISNSNEDDFIHNLLTILGEFRAAMVVYQPAALLKNPTGVQADAAESTGKARR